MSAPYDEQDTEIKSSYYQLTGAALSFLERVLKVSIKLHATEDELTAGDIFLFNHFSKPAFI